MKQLRQLPLILALLSVVAFSSGFTKNLSSFQSKSIEYHFITLAADDIDDDFGDPEFEIFCQPVLPTLNWEFDSNENPDWISPQKNLAVPFYLQIKNLRI